MHIQILISSIKYSLDINGFSNHCDDMINVDVKNVLSDLVIKTCTKLTDVYADIIEHTWFIVDSNNNEFKFIFEFDIEKNQIDYSLIPIQKPSLELLHTL